ncbi:hemerythrin domain-containing protein [Flagellimonas marinaquae]
MDSRVNIYGFPHKGLRNALGKLSQALAAVNPENQDQLKEVGDLGREVSKLLNLHLHSEEQHVLPPLEAKVPKSTDHNHEDQKAMAQLEEEMLAAIEAMEAQPSIPSAENAYRHVNLFIREYFRHMDEEEIDLNTVIWEHFTDEDILGWQGNILSNISPADMATWFKYIIPALMPHEQRIMLGGFKSNVPTEVFENTIKSLEPYLTTDQNDFIQTI